jgi:hypothetical protein
MKNNKIIKCTKIFAMLIFSLVFTVSCSDEDDDFVSDSSEVIPTIFSFDGPAKGFIDEIVTYSVKPRGGSEFIWSATGAVIQPISGRTDMVNVLYNQQDDLASVSVFERAFNGKESAVSTISAIKVFGTPCNWTLVMKDSFGDGWNGASLSFTFDGFDAGELTLDGDVATEILPVPNGSVFDVTFTSGEWDGEVSYKLYDGDENLVFEKEAGTYPDNGVVYTGTNVCPQA